jgi:hypothetical protein
MLIKAIQAACNVFLNTRKSAVAHVNSTGASRKAYLFNTGIVSQLTGIYNNGNI